MNMYMWVGAQAIGALSLADRIEDWDPEHQAKLQQVGLRSSFELDDEEGKVFVALSTKRYPFGVMGRRNTVGDLFVSKVIAFPEKHFSMAVDKIEETGIELIIGSEAEELLRKMEQAKGIALRSEKNEEIWEVENWDQDEWVEQVLAEIAFAKAMKVQHVPECNKFCGSVAGYRVRRAADCLVLVPSDNNEDREGGNNKKPGDYPGLVARIGGEGSTVLSEELLDHSRRGLAQYGNTPWQATISRALALKLAYLNS
jgi:hypothetical protein